MVILLLKEQKTKSGFQSAALVSVHLQLITFPPDDSDTLTVFLQTLSHLQLFDAVKNIFLLQQMHPNFSPNRGGANSPHPTCNNTDQNFVIDPEPLVIECLTSAWWRATFQATSPRSYGQQQVATIFHLSSTVSLAVQAGRTLQQAVSSGV